MHDNEFKLCAAIAVCGATVALLSLTGCDRGQPAAQSTATIAEPSIVRELRVACETAAAEAAATGKDGKSAASAGQVALKDAFQRAIAEGHLHEIEKFVEACVKAEDRERWIAYELQAELDFEYISRPSKPDLVRVLSWGSTDHSSYWCIEGVLTIDATWTKVPDGLTVLFDAYDLAGSAQAKDANYFAVWRALGDLPIKTKNQDEYMRVGRRWYEENRSRLERQRGYDHTDFIYAPRESWPGDSRLHLFKMKESAAR